MSTETPEMAMLFGLRQDLTSCYPGIDLDASTPCPSWTSEEYAAWALLRNILKKYCPKNEPSQEAQDVALDKFLRVNDACRTWELDTDSLAEKEAEILGLLKDELYRFWHGGEEGYPLVSSLTELFELGRAGKGASVGANGCDFLTKYADGPVTSSTEDLHEMWMRLVNKNPTWAAAEKHRLGRYKDDVVRGSVLSFVPKNVDVARTICTEPSINMWFQLGLGEVISDRLHSRFGIQIEKQQQIQQQLAREGSVGGAFSTIDLSSASDSISLGMLRQFLPKDWLSWLTLLRCGETSFKGLPIRLHMVSSMGNGYTFPLQTAIFASVVRAVYRFHGLPLIGSGGAERRNYGVYGDDIICYASVDSDVRRVLNLLGFVVNTEKSFFEGPFRESCGGDYYRGSDVRSVYIKNLQTDASIYVAINSLVMWSGKTGSPLPKTIQALIDLCEFPILRVPPGIGLDLGVWVPFSRRPSSHSPGHGIHTYQCLEPVSLAMDVGDDGSVTLSQGKKRVSRMVEFENLLLAFLYGSIRGMRVSLRQREIRYRRVTRITSGWDSWHAGANHWLPGNRTSALECSRQQYGGWSHWLDGAPGCLPGK